MTHYETFNGEAPLGYHELQHRAEVGRKTARQIRSEFLGEATRNAAVSTGEFYRELKRVAWQHVTELADRYFPGHPA